MDSRKLLTNIAIFLKMIKVEHTVFALPFAYVGAILVEKSIPSTSDLIWITLAMIGARTAAMCLNRIIDKHIDARNPRTADRALPRGLISLKSVWIYTLLSITLLLIATLNLSDLAFKLFPVALFMLFFYPYTKRFTWLCHLFLGATLALAPIGAWVAIANSIDTGILVLGFGVMFWVAGFDIVYACSDYDFDKRHGIHSIPACFGITNALYISRIFHIITIILLTITGVVFGLGILYFIGILLSTMLLLHGHRAIKKFFESGEKKSQKEISHFFELNGILSMAVFIFTWIDITI